LAPSAGGLRFSGFKVKVWWDGARVVAAASSPIKSPRLQPHLGSDVEKLVGVVWSSRTSSGGSSFFFVYGTDVAFLARSATSRSQLTTSCRLWKERQRRRAVDTVWRLKMKGISKILM
jgi:hypothetical protein